MAAIVINGAFMAVFQGVCFVQVMLGPARVHPYLIPCQRAHFFDALTLSQGRVDRKPAKAMAQTIAIPWWSLVVDDKARNHHNDPPYRFGSLNPFCPLESVHVFAGADRQQGRHVKPQWTRSGRPSSAAPWRCPADALPRGRYLPRMVAR